MVESVDFNEITLDIVIKYYYTLINESNKEYTFKNYLDDIKKALGVFPFFVMVWFNTEDEDKLLDKIFPIRFMKNFLKYLKYFNNFNF